MIVYFKKNKRPACYDSENLITGSRPPIQHLCGPFKSCGECPYASHGFICYSSEGDCLKTDMQKIENYRKAGKR